MKRQSRIPQTRQAVSQHIVDYGLHLHFCKVGNLSWHWTWRMVVNNNALCGTARCVKVAA